MASYRLLSGAGSGPAGRRHVWPDVRRARHYLRRDEGREFRAWRLHDARHVRGVLSRHRLRRIRCFSAPISAPSSGRRSRGQLSTSSAGFCIITLISRVTGARVVSAEAEGHYAQIILTLGIALVLANGGLILFGSTPLSVQTPLSRESWEIGPIFLNQARAVGFVMAVVSRSALSLPHAH